ncbi:MAG: DUF4968 domain-containing protein [Saprospirales bacterium]|nr:DUF4968 domain-containing protein [Saprospirales bacterium]
MAKEKKPHFSISPDGTVAQEFITVNERAPDAHYDHIPDLVEGMERDGNTFLFLCGNGICLEIKWLGSKLIRFRYALDGLFDRDFSYATDPQFKPEPGLLINLAESDEKYILSSESLQCHIERSSLRVHLADHDGRWICREKQGFYGRSTILRGKIRLGVSKELRKGARYYGLGDKSGDLCLNGKAYVNWNTDAFSFGAGSDPLYKSIPFFYGLQDHRAFGIFLDNTHRSRFDFGKTRRDELFFESEGGEMSYYFFYGPALSEVAMSYARLTGVPELPPIWALGFHQSRWSYFPDSRLLEVARTFRDRKIPCDSLYLDIDYMDGFRCFSWDPAHFPDPKGLIGGLKELGFHTVVMIDPGIKIDREYWVYKEGMEKKLFCFRGNGDLMTGPVWPQECVFPDFTNPETRAWWGELYRELYLEQGVAGFWNDMNEPAVFKISQLTFPDDVRHDYDGQPCNHLKAHNIYGHLMARASREGLKKLDPRRRPFILTRAGFAGGQRDAATWTGDNVASWEHLKIAHRQAQRLSISGFGFCGSDIGGFMGQPDGEMMLRWLQMGVFHPFFRIHSMGNNLSGASGSNPDWVHEQEAKERLDQEPWAFGKDWEILNRKAIEARYQWLPYLYTSFWDWVKTGFPILKSLVFWDQEDPQLLENEDGVWVGKDILVYPVLAPGQKTKTVYLPKGKWLDFHTGKNYDGGKKHKLRIHMDQIPVFVRGGAIIPQHPVRQSTAFPAEELILRIYPGEEGTYTSTLYEDAGEGYGADLVFRFEFLVFSWGGRIRVNTEGEFSNPYKKLRIQAPGVFFERAECKGESIPVQVFKWGTEILIDPFPSEGKDPGFEVLFEKVK